LARKFRAAQATNELLALAREHRADDYFNPTHIAFDNVQDGQSFRSALVMIISPKLLH
jgi:hypothetical protein